jgi:hypothetical protein
LASSTSADTSLKAANRDGRKSQKADPSEAGPKSYHEEAKLAGEAAAGQ